MADQELGKVDFAGFVGPQFEANVPAGQGRGDEVNLVLEANGATFLHASGHEPFVVDLLGCALPAARAGGVDFGWPLHAQRLVGPLFIELFTPMVEGGLPLGVIEALDFGAEVAMQALVMAVVAGSARTTAQQVDAQRYPQAESRESPKGLALLAKGDPLSLRMARGNPCNSKSRLKLA